MNFYEQHIAHKSSKKEVSSIMNFYEHYVL